MMELANNNYFSEEANEQYMSATQFKGFRRCEAAALAELRGEYTPPASQAFLVGGYIDAHFAGESDQYALQHPEIFKKNGELKAEFIHAQKIIERMERDELYSLLMAGEKQVIRTGEIAGVPFKIKIDSLLNEKQCYEIAERFPDTKAALIFADGAIVDQKVMKDLDSIWDPEQHARVSFVEAFGYDIQGAIYQEIEGNALPFILAVGTKESEPDLAALYIPDRDLEAALNIVKENATRYQAIKKGQVKPRRCERCDYCKRTRKLSGIISFSEF